MKNVSKLESGKIYTLSQIFSKDLTIAIPDLQRDYCWGLETYDNKGRQQGELVSGFLASLKSSWEEISDTKDYTPMGLIYGYEWPKGTFQLCDGQQRITTLYLLAGELYKNDLISESAKESLRDILIKFSEGNDIITSGLQYSIRETTLYFLCDLVSHYFISGECSLPFFNMEEREKNHLVLKLNGRPSWYFLEYDNDPTIQSMLGAIYTIQKFVKESFNDPENITSFAEAIANRFSFIYYDMGNRMRGEETFVVLNTTGEPLTSTENLKPLLIGGMPNEDKTFLSEISQQWEDREDWFWKHKSYKELTSDELSRDFYTWWLLTNGDKESVSLIKDYMALDIRSCIEDIHCFYKSLIAIIAWIYNSDEAKKILLKISEWTNERIDCTSEITILTWLRASSRREIILPLVAFYSKFGENDTLKILRRLTKNYYIGKTTKGEDDPDNLRPYIKFRDIINTIKQSATSLDVFNHISWYNQDEQKKEVIFINKENDLLEIELDNNLRFDLNVLWQSGVDTIDKVKFARKRLFELHNLAQGRILDTYDESTSIFMANSYRLVRFLKGWGHPNGKQEYVNWKQWGTWFTYDRYSDNLSRAYKDADMWTLLNSDNLYASLNRLTKDIIVTFQLSEDIFSVQSLSNANGIMRAWLISKFLINTNTEEGNRLITPYDSYSLCVNKEDLPENKINKSLPMSIGNICLHHVNRNGPWTVQIPYYNNSTCLDSPLFAGVLKVDYKEFTAGNLSEGIINQTTNYILKLFDEYIEKPEYRQL